MSALFRLSGAVETDLAIARWFDERVGELGSMAWKWFIRMRSRGDDVRELLHDGCPVVCVEDAPFAYVNAFKAHINVGFFHGADLDDPSGILQGTGKSMRHVKLMRGECVDDSLLEALIDLAYGDIRVRLGIANQTQADSESGARPK